MTKKWTKVGDTYALHFPFWVRILSRFAEDGNDGMTRFERRHLARRYARTAGRKPSRRDIDRYRRLLEERSDK